YPDASGHEARGRMAARLGCDAAEIALGHGAAELLWTLARLLLPGRDAVALAPTFCEYAVATQAVGGHLASLETDPAEDFRIDTARLGAAIAAARPAVAWLCAPNSPTGAPWPAVAIAALAASVPETTFVVDQSFLSLSEAHADAAVPMPDNVVRVRSLTKDHALAAVRVGYLLAAPALIARLDAHRPPWVVSGLAQAAAPEALDNDAFVATCRARLLADRRWLAQAVTALGARALPTSTPFFLADVGDAAAVRHALLTRHGVLVRDCASYGLPRHIRVGTRAAPDNRRLVEALGEVLIP
ncbi:MAG TPA: histidinol-phosphate transaminase, partial [Myxococcota bacterium]|nr:histidinol-phosphate transaminase [Myxococcota bacterium]